MQLASNLHVYIFLYDNSANFIVCAYMYLLMAWHKNCAMQLMVNCTYSLLQLFFTNFAFLTCIICTHFGVLTMIKDNQGAYVVLKESKESFDKKIGEITTFHPKLQSFQNFTT